MQQGFEMTQIFTGVHRMYFDFVSEVVSHNYDQEWSVADLKKVFREVYVIKFKFINTFSPVCTSGLYTIEFRLLDHVIQIISWFRSLLALKALPYKQYDIYTNAVYFHTFIQRATHMDETGLV